MPQVNLKNLRPKWARIYAQSELEFTPKVNLKIYAKEPKIGQSDVKNLEVEPRHGFQVSPSGHSLFFPQVFWPSSSHHVAQPGAVYDACARMYCRAVALLAAAGEPGGCPMVSMEFHGSAY